MSEFGARIDGLAGLRRGWEEMTKAAADHRAGAAPGRLREVTGFGANPGQLRMLALVPEALRRNAPLVVVLHGCLQDGTYEAGAGWSDLADRLGFALLCPEQVRGNNANMCFNWFQPADVTRGSGEVESIHEMIEHMLATHGLDRKRVFITGLSAGGAMTGAMLATYPELFAGGAIIAGLPYGGANGLQEALDCMMRGRTRTPAEWAAVIHAASPGTGHWPRISVWHGLADHTVAPANADAIVKQWQAAMDLPPEPARQDKVDGAQHRVWRNARGTDVLEEFLIAGLGHGTPIDPKAADPARRCGTAAPFVLDAGIPSTLHIARFWGLLPTVPAGGKPAAAPQPAARLGARLSELVTARKSGSGVLGAAGRALDPGPVIERALRAAGLLKPGRK